MFDSPFHYNYIQKEKIQIRRQSFFQSTPLKKTKKTIQTKNEIVNLQKKMSVKKFTAKPFTESKFSGGGVSYFIEDENVDLNLDFSNASALVEIHCKKSANVNLKQKFSGLFSINFLVEKNAELNISASLKSDAQSLANFSGINKGVLNLQSSSLVDKSHSDVLFDIKNQGSASLSLKSVVLNGSFGLKGADSLESESIGKTKIGVLLVGSNTSASILPTASIESDKQFFSHSARIEKISDEELFYLKTRGLKEENAKKMIYEGFLKSEMR